MKNLLALVQTSLENLSIDRRILNQLHLFDARKWRVFVVLPNSQNKLIRGTLFGKVEFISFPYPNYRGRNYLEEYIRSFAKLPELRADNLFEDRDLEQSVEAFRRANKEFNPYPLTGEFIRYSDSVSCDAILACDYPVVLASLLMARQKNIPFLFDSHEFCLGEGNHSPFMKQVIKQVEGDSIQQALIFYTISDFFADLFKYEYKLKYQPKYVCNSPKFSSTHKSIERDWIARKLGIPSSSRVILFHGGLWPQNRNIERLVTSFLKVKKEGQYLLFLGYGSLAEPLRSIGNNVLYHPAVSQQELPLWVSSASACIIPYVCVGMNQRFCMPNKLFDCIELGVPLIVNENLENLKKIVSSYKIGYSGSMETDEDMELTLCRSFEWLEGSDVSPEDFRQAQEEYGWDIQKCRFFEIIDELEAYLDGKQINHKKLSPLSKVAENLWSWGHKFKEQGWMDKAISEYQKALDVEPRHIQAATDLVELCRETDNLSKALASLLEAIKANPSLSDLYQFLGDVFGYRGDDDRAIRAYRKAIEIRDSSEQK